MVGLRQNSFVGAAPEFFWLGCAGILLLRLRLSSLVGLSLNSFVGLRLNSLAGLLLHSFVGLCLNSFVGLRSNPFVRLCLNSFGPLLGLPLHSSVGAAPKFFWLGCAKILLVGLRLNSFSWATPKILPCAKTTWLAAANADDLACCHSHRRVGLVVVSASVLACCHARRRLGLVSCSQAFWLAAMRVDDLACCHVRRRLVLVS